MVLDTTMLKGFIISILATVITFVAVFVLAGTFLAAAALTGGPRRWP